MRGSLHAHILAWFHARDRPAGHKDLEPIPRDSKIVADSRQRPTSHVVLRQEDVDPDGQYQEDNVCDEPLCSRVHVCAPIIVTDIGVVAIVSYCRGAGEALTMCTITPKWDVSPLRCVDLMWLALLEGHCSVAMTTRS